MGFFDGFQTGLNTLVNSPGVFFDTLTGGDVPKTPEANQAVKSAVEKPGGGNSVLAGAELAVSDPGGFADFAVSGSPNPTNNAPVPAAGSFTVGLRTLVNDPGTFFQTVFGDVPNTPQANKTVQNAVTKPGGGSPFLAGTEHLFSDPSGFIKDAIDLTPWWVYAGLGIAGLVAAAYVVRSFK